MRESSIILVLGISLLAACGGDQPTSSGPPSVPPRPRPPITLAAIGPQTVFRSTQPQLLMVTGSGVPTTLAVSVTSPTGTVTQVAASEVTNVTASGFAVSAVLTDAGTWTLRAQSTDGVLSASIPFTVLAPAKPVIGSMSPAVLYATGNQVFVTLRGVGFKPGLTVTITPPAGQTVLAPFVLKSSSLDVVGESTFVLLAPPLFLPGILQFDIQNPDGEKSNSFLYKLDVSPTPPAITGVGYTPGPGSRLVVVTGAGFLPAVFATMTSPAGVASDVHAIQWGSDSYFSFLTSALNVNGTWTISATNAANAVSNSFAFRVPAYVVPTITSIEPASPVAGYGANVTIRGTDFTSDDFFLLEKSGITVGAGGPLVFVSPSAVQLYITFPSAGRYALHATTPDGQVSLPFNVDVTPAPPALNSILPVLLTAGPGSQLITLSGSNFLPGLTLALRSPAGVTTTLPATSLQSAPPASVQATAVLSSAGDWSIRATNPDGRQSSELPFIVLPPAPPPPSITAITPSTVPNIRPLGIQHVTISGAGFQPGMSAVVQPEVGSAFTSRVTVLSSTSALVDAQFSRDGTLKATNPDGQSSSAFPYKGDWVAPVLTSATSLTTSDTLQELRLLGNQFEPAPTVILRSPSGVLK